MKVVRFNWHEDHVINGAEINAMHPTGVAGLIAEDVAAVAKDAAIYAGANDHDCPRGEGIEEGDAIGIDNDRMIAYLVDAVQYLYAKAER
jgi:hypothetical protein